MKTFGKKKSNMQPTRTSLEKEEGPRPLQRKITETIGVVKRRRLRSGEGPAEDGSPAAKVADGGRGRPAGKEMVLNAGQDLVKKCTECQLLYFPSSKEDSAMHRKLHKQLLKERAAEKCTDPKGSLEEKEAGKRRRPCQRGLGAGAKADQ